MRKETADTQLYRLRQCIVTNNKHYSGFGRETGPIGPTGPDVAYAEEHIRKKGEVVLERDKMERKYLHVAEGTLGSDLGAGLFKQ